jgi:hypothetical protein
MRVILWILAGLALAGVIAWFVIWLGYERKTGKVVVWAPWLDFSVSAAIFLYWLVKLFMEIQNGSKNLIFYIIIPILWLCTLFPTFKESKAKYDKRV